MIETAGCRGGYSRAFCTNASDGDEVVELGKRLVLDLAGVQEVLPESESALQGISP